MKRTGSRHLAAGAGLTLATLLYGGLLVLGSMRPAAFRLDPFDLGDVLVTTAPYLFAVMGAAITVKRPKQRMGAIFLVAGLLSLGSYTTFEYSVAGLYGPHDLPLAEEVSWISMWGWVLMLGGFAAILLTYPTGRAVSGRWNIGFLFLGLGTCAGLAGAVGYWPHRGVALFEATTSEDGAPFPGVSDAAEALLAAAPLLVIAGILVGILSVIVRFRRSDGDERQQIKGLLLAALLLVVAGLLDVLAPALGLATPGTFDVLMPLALLGIPVAAGLAILRYRLYDIDLVINRTIVYALLTGVLAMTYLAMVVVIQALLGPLTEDSDLAVAGSTLAAAAMFRPLRARIQGFIDRRFYRRKYDAQHTLETFSSRLRDDVDLDHLARDLVSVVRDTMQPAHASVWLRTARS